MTKRKIIAIVLAMTLIAAVSSYAYFTDALKLDGTNGNPSVSSLTITNGTVDITGTIHGDASGFGAWSYDVTRLSNGATPVATEANRRSPDIGGVGAGNFTTANRCPIGAKVTGVITKARPGDAFVLGDASAAANDGLKFTNSSSLTTKIGMLYTSTGAAELQKLISIGWKLYVDGVEILPASVVAGTPVKNITLANGASQSVVIRLEFPPSSGNTYQGAQTKTAGGVVSGFDLSAFIEIKATQENNPGWETDGT